MVCNCSTGKESPAEYLARLKSPTTPADVLESNLVHDGMLIGLPETVDPQLAHILRILNEPSKCALFAICAGESSNPYSLAISYGLKYPAIATVMRSLADISFPLQEVLHGLTWQQVFATLKEPWENYTKTLYG